MAASAVMLVTKAVLIAATGKRTQTATASMMVAALTPFILIIVVILSILSGTSSHNNAAADLTFHGGCLSPKLLTDYRMYIEKMRGSFVDLDAALAGINVMSEGGRVDAYQVKAISYSLFFGADQPRTDDGDYRSFAGYFVIYEERLDEGEEPYTVAAPITNLETVYGNLAILLGKPVTTENKSNAQRIYVPAKYGQISPGSGLSSGEALGDDSYAALIVGAEKYLGYPYVQGGSTPRTPFGYNDFVCRVCTQSGVYNPPRIPASGIYNQYAIVPRDEAQPGGPVFFIRTYMSSDPISHVEIYVGRGRVLHCGSPIQYTSVEISYWREHSYATGRLSN